jgi:Transposase DDE domain
MDQFITIESHREPWNKGKLVGQKAPFKLKEIWAIRVRPQLSSFSRNRHGRFRESGVFRHVFENVLRRCMSEGLVGGEGFAVDASVVKADASRARRIPGGEMIDWLEADGSTRAVKEYLDALEENGAPETTPKLLSLTDPAARWTAAPGGPAFFGYSINYLIDLDAAVIVDVEATPAFRTEEVNATRTMIERVEERFEMKPARLVGDAAYGAAPMLNWLVHEKQIEPHVPVLDKTQRDDGTLSRSDFIFDEPHDRYICPKGKYLHTTGRTTVDDTILYRSKNLECASCPLKSQCCPNTPNRKIARSLYETARDVTRAVVCRRLGENRRTIADFALTDMLRRSNRYCRFVGPS